MPGQERLSRSDRERRDGRALELFLAGLTYREIGAAVGLRSVSGVHRVVAKQLAAGAQRRELLTGEPFALWQERTEALFQAHWDRALEGDHRSAELCRKVLAQQARVHGLSDDVRVAAPTPGSPEDGPTDELSRLREARRR